MEKEIQGAKQKVRRPVTALLLQKQMGWRFVVAGTKGKQGTETRSTVVFMVW